MHRSILAITAFLIAGACSDDGENPRSESTELGFEFPIDPPVVLEGWPCPPFDDIETVEEDVGDDDGDSLTDCQELAIGSDPNNPDSDGDGVGDFFEVGDVAEATDTDGDGNPDIIDPDDDNDGIPTVEEDPDGDGDPTNDDGDLDGLADYQDPDHDNDQVLNIIEDAEPAGNGNGDPRDDDFDGDGIFNLDDPDDENDGIPTLLEDVNKNFDSSDDDTDCDGEKDWLDADDDGDGILSIDEATGDLDADTLLDGQDIDEDGDTILTLDEDLNGNGNLEDDDTDGDGIPNYRDADDDGDTVDTMFEDIEALLGLETTPSGSTTDGTDTGTFVCSVDEFSPNLVVGDDTDGDGRDNYLDPDDDDDGCLTIDEGDPDPNSNVLIFDYDSDGDGTPDFIDADSADCVPVAPSGPYDLQVTGMMFIADNASGVLISVQRDSDSMVVASDNGVVSSDGFNFSFAGVLDEGETYTVDFFIDADMSGICEIPEVSYRIAAVEAAGANVVLVTDPLSNGDPAACATFP